jgi:hypothetical protein
MSYPKNLHEIILIRKGITARKEKEKKRKRIEKQAWREKRKRDTAFPSFGNSENFT